MQEASSLDNNLENFDTLSESPFTNNIVNINTKFFMTFVFKLSQI